MTFDHVHISLLGDFFDPPPVGSPTDGLIVKPALVLLFDTGQDLAASFFQRTGPQNSKG